VVIEPKSARQELLKIAKAAMKVKNLVTDPALKMVMVFHLG
jgi:hypothetical protein